MTIGRRLDRLEGQLARRGARYDDAWWKPRLRAMVTPDLERLEALMVKAGAEDGPADIARLDAGEFEELQAILRSVGADPASQQQEDLQ